jgi:glycosyltransferase involved in cell wall biosynthesis
VTPSLIAGGGPRVGVEDPVGDGPQRRLSVGMALYGDVTYDSRVRREASTLAGAGYDVTIVCLAGQSGAPDLPANVTIRVQRPAGRAIIPGSSNPYFQRSGIGAIRDRVAWLLTYVRGLRGWGRLAVAAAGSVDLWHAHDLTGLAAIVPHVPDGIPVIYDSHELFLETGTALKLPWPARSVLRWYGRRLVSRTTAVVTVNEALASELRRTYRTERVYAVHNCPDRRSLPGERSTALRDAVGVGATAPIVLYHGALSENRGIEQLMEAMLEPRLAGAHLCLMGAGEMREALDGAVSDPRWEGRIHVLDPVLPVDLIGWVSSADVGAIPLQASTLNLRLSTPNKLFECLAAGTPVVVSDFTAMREIVLGPDGPLGAVCDPASPRSIARAIGSLLDLPAAERQALRERCLAAAATRWNWDHEAQTLLGVYRAALS